MKAELMEIGTKAKEAAGKISSKRCGYDSENCSMYGNSLALHYRAGE